MGNTDSLFNDHIGLSDDPTISGIFHVYLHCGLVAERTSVGGTKETRQFEWFGEFRDDLGLTDALCSRSYDSTADAENCRGYRRWMNGGWSREVGDFLVVPVRENLASSR